MRSPRPLGISALALLAAVAACGGAREPATASPASFGAESLRVALVRTPAEVADGGAVAVSAVARNRTAVPIVVRLACPAGGLAVRVLDAAGQVRVQAPVVCRSEVRDGVYTIPAGDSVMLRATLPVLGPPGTYRVAAVYETAHGRSPAAEWPLLVRRASR